MKQPTVEQKRISLKSLGDAGLGDTSGTTSMITSRVRIIMNLMSDNPVKPEVRAMALHALADMLAIAASKWSSYLAEDARRARRPVHDPNGGDGDE